MVSIDMYQNNDQSGSTKSNGLPNDYPSKENSDTARTGVRVDRARWNAVGQSRSGDTCSPWIRAAKLPELFCSWDLAYRCTRSGWLKPVLRGKRRTIYRLADVLHCLLRIEAGELPSARPKRAGR